MRVEYDEEADAVYISLLPPGRSRSLPPVARTVPVEEILPSILNLDFNNEGELVGIEVLGASLLPAEFLRDFANRDLEAS